MFCSNLQFSVFSVLLFLLYTYQSKFKNFQNRNCIFAIFVYGRFLGFVFSVNSGQPVADQR